MNAFVIALTNLKVEEGRHDVVADHRLKWLISLGSAAVGRSAAAF
jgi:hypothetical protein